MGPLGLPAGRPGFLEALTLARELQNNRHSPLDQQLAACRTLVRSLPASLPAGAANQLVCLASDWLATGSSHASTTGGSSNDAVPALVAQLQTEAANLFLALFGVPRVKLQSAACRQLLQQLCRLCRDACSPREQSPGIAGSELACACMDLLAQLPHWYPQPPKAELSAAVAAVAAVLEQQAVGPGGTSSGGGAPPAEAASTSRLLCKVLKALQVLLAEAKKDHGAHAGSLALVLQRLFAYGWQQRGGSSSGSSTPKRSAGGGLAAPPLVAASKAATSPGRAPLPAGLQAGPAQLRSGPVSPGKYRPPHARSSSSSQEEAQAAGSAAAAAYRRRSSSDTATVPAQPLESSDSESSDMEGSSGEVHRASRVRSGALACLQLLAKADPKSLHASWTVLLPMADAVSSRSGGLWASSGAYAAGRGGGSSGNSASVAHLVLHDPQLRVRHAAAATITTLLEGPAQRAYLAVAEARDLERQPVRGFITLSASLGQMLLALHRALLHSIQCEPDALVLASVLRALGTLLLGAPYHRLPPQLLPLCVRALLGCLAKATPPSGPASLSAEQLPVASACLACLAAAFSSKAAAAALAEQLLSPQQPQLQLQGSQVDAGLPATSREGQEQQLLQLLFAYAACQHPALQLEAVMALRGVAQQHAVLLHGCWERMLELSKAGAALPAPAVPQSPRSQQGAADGTVPEKVAQQSVRLPGDFLENQAQAQAQGQAATRLACCCSGGKTGPTAATFMPTAAMPPTAAEAGPLAAAEAASARWQQLCEQVLVHAVQHSSPLLRAAAQAVISALSPPTYAALPHALQQHLLGWCCAAAAEDEASPVRAAATKAVGAVAACPALCMLPEGPARVLAALSAGCHDNVLAVRIPAAASLASFCQMLCQATLPAGAAAAAGAAPNGGSAVQQPASMPQALAASAAVLPACLRLAVAIAADSEKLRPSGLQALGCLFTLQAGVPAGLQQVAEQQHLLGAAAEAVQQCLGAGSARVQWAAAETAGQLLACTPPEAQPHWSPLLRQLLALLEGCPNFRSRALAAAALRQLGGRAALPPGSLAALLDSVAGVLFDGKPSGFAVPTPPANSAAPPAAAAQQQQQQPRPEPSDLGSKAQLEAGLVAAVLHLLSLLPGAAAAAGDGAAAAVGLLRSSSHIAHMQQLVQQAHQELLLKGSGSDLYAAAGMAASRMHQGLPLFDLSQASTALAAAAAAGLLLLQ